MFVTASAPRPHRRFAHGRGVAVAGWREIGGIRHYYRSKAEMRFAAYLQWKKGLGEILEWAPEPEEFWFEAIKRGVRSYKPDFRVVEKTGEVVFFETKGWLDPRSKTALKRMAKYHPEVTVKVIDSRWFQQNGKLLASLVPGWEP